MREYIIWGIPPTYKEEIIVCEKIGNDYITSLEQVERVKEILSKKGVQKMRVQEINFDGKIKFFI